MKDLLEGMILLLLFASVIGFIVGFFMVFLSQNKKLAVKIMIFSVIGFVIGFGACLSTFSLGNMH
jgi:uncharacterized membrane protein YczE